MSDKYYIKPIADFDLFEKHAEGYVGIFGSKKWLSVYGDSICVYGIYQNAEKLVGGFYLYETKKIGLPFIKLPPYTPHCGFFFNSVHQNKGNINGFRKEIISTFCDFIESKNPAISILALPPSIIELQPFIWKNYKVIPNYTYQIDLLNPLEFIISNFDAKHRNAINKAIKENVIVKVNQTNHKKLLSYFQQHLKHVGANIYEKEMGSIFNIFSNSENSFSLSATINEEILGHVFCIHDQKTCYYMFGAINKKSKIQGINNLLILKSMEKAKEIGCSVFDFEGSMIKGVDHFFKGFGGNLIPYFTINKAILPLEIALKFKKRSIF